MQEQSSVTNVCNTVKVQGANADEHFISYLPAFLHQTVNIVSMAIDRAASGHTRACVNFTSKVKATTKQEMKCLQ